MRLLSVQFLTLLLALPGRATPPPPSDRPTAWLPDVGSVWLTTAALARENVAAAGFGMRPTRAVAAVIRQGYQGAEADVAFELLPGDGDRPNLVLDSRGHGATMTERLDSVLLGGSLGRAQATAGIARHGDGDLRPLLHLRLPVKVPLVEEAWIGGGFGGLEGPVLEAGWSPQPGLFMSVGWRRNQGLVTTASFRFDMHSLDHPWPARSRRPDGGAWTDIGPFQPPAGNFQAALPTAPPPRFTLSSHRLGLPGVSTTLLGEDVERWRRHRGSPAEMRRHARFARAATPDALARHWELHLDATVELEPAPKGEIWPSRASAGAQLHLLPWPGLILTGAGRVAAAGALPAPRYDPPSPGRDDAGLYLGRRYSLDRAQMAFAAALSADLDLLLEAGHLDPLYGGGGAELRWQPPLDRWSVGIMAHHVWKRPPTVETLYRGTGRTTGFVSAGWEGRDAGLRSELSLGRYLAGDWGGGFTLTRQFGHGAALSLDATASTRTSRLGLALTMPFGGLGGHVETSGRLRVRPMAREYAERLDRTLTLSDLRHAAGYGRIIQDWDQGLQRGS